MKTREMKIFSLKNRVNNALPKRIRVLGLLFVLFFLCWLPQNAISEELSDLERCMLEAMETASDDITMGELRQNCLRKIRGLDKVGQPTAAVAEKKEAGIISWRLKEDMEHTLEPFTLMAHKPNYLLIASYNASGINEELFREQFDDPSIDLDHVEAKFQLSIKTPLFVGKRMDIYAAYTNRSFWQLYNDDQSSPFRDTNHEPETWLQIRNNWSLWGFKNPANSFGFVHQSNGRGGILSRSWNRLYASIFLERGNLAINLKPWYRIPEDEEDDDNEDIEDYLGYGEIRSSYKWNNHTFSLMLRNILGSGFKKGTLETAWSFPIWKYEYLRGYILYFNGYGESLIDYNLHSNSIGIGVLLTDWL